ncbi:hypothetical protein PR048_005922 [Dryococelus australis]|uniref:Uncharacterized protein n=1 Tax=Dryococelus australis TaxID=614101 RepID=A0ABQ9IAI4_9NEOP|nr:hypothetical protein PR048_005922 [Dryococelus australis]
MQTERERERGREKKVDADRKRKREREKKVDADRKRKREREKKTSVYQSLDHRQCAFSLLAEEYSREKKTSISMASSSVQVKRGSWTALSNRVLRVDGVEARVGTQGRRKREIPEKTTGQQHSRIRSLRAKIRKRLRPAIEPSSPWWEVAAPTAGPSSER